VAVVCAGALHVLTELALSWRVAAAYNAGVALAFLVYVVWRGRRSPGALRAWGMRRDNLARALVAQLAFATIGAAVLVGFGAACGTLDVPPTIWLTLALYPAWSLAQQLALQSFVARNLAGWIRHPLALAIAASVLFSLSHVPEIELVVLTAVAGVFFTLIYRRLPNLWAVAIAHAILGTLAVYFVLGRDPGGAILDWLRSR
jgi:membrane protease YdiL (CAAX protease family)